MLVSCGTLYWGRSLWCKTDTSYKHCLLELMFALSEAVVLSTCQRVHVVSNVYRDHLWVVGENIYQWHRQWVCACHNAVFGVRNTCTKRLNYPHFVRDVKYCLFHNSYATYKWKICPQISFLVNSKCITPFSKKTWEIWGLYSQMKVVTISLSSGWVCLLSQTNSRSLFYCP